MVVIARDLLAKALVGVVALATSFPLPFSLIVKGEKRLILFELLELLELLSNSFSSSTSKNIKILIV